MWVDSSLSVLVERGLLHQLGDCAIKRLLLVWIFGGDGRSEREKIVGIIVATISCQPISNASGPHKHSTGTKILKPANNGSMVKCCLPPFNILEVVAGCNLWLNVYMFITDIN